MDPLSLLLSISGVVKLVTEVSSTLFTFIQDTKNIDNSLKAFFTEINSLKRAITTIETSLQNPLIRSYQTDAEKEEMQELWSSIEQSILECRVTCLELDQVLDKIRGITEKRNPLKSQIQTHNIKMQLILQTINIHISSKGPKIVIETLNPKLDVLIDMMADLTLFQHDNISAPQGQVQSTERLKKAAGRVASRACSVGDGDDGASNYKESLMGGSEYGEVMSPESRARISKWTIEKVIHEEETLDEDDILFNDSALGSGSQIRSQNENSQIDEDSDSEGDISLELFNALSQKGNSHYRNEEMEEAEKFFRSALGQAPSLGSKKGKFVDQRHLKLQLGMACFKQAKWNDSKTVLLELTQEYGMTGTNTDEEAAQALVASHTLAQVHMELEEFDEAEQCCKRTVVGRRRLFGKKHSFYFESVILLVSIYQGKGDAELAAGYSSLLPAELVHTTPTPKPPTKTLVSRNQNLSVASRKAKGSPNVIPNSTSQKGTIPKELEAIFAKSGYEYDSFDPDKALHWAASGGNVPAIQALLSNEFNIGANMSVANEYGFMAIHLAAKEGHEAAVKALLEHKADADARMVPSKVTPLILAAEKGHEAVCQVLLDGGAYVNAKRNGNWTALHYAIQNGQESITQMLLKKGADVTAEEGSAVDVPLHLAAWKGNDTIVQLLLQHNAEVDAKGLVRGFTAMHQAVLGGNDAVVKLLLKQGADVNASGDNGGYTPLHQAAHDGRVVIAKILLEEGAEVNARTRSKLTPLHVAAMSGQTLMIRLLLNHGANIINRASNGEMAIHKAVERGHLEAVKVLLDSKADVNARGKSNLTPLHYAAKGGFALVAQLLLKHGADINAMGDDWGFFDQDGKFTPQEQNTNTNAKSNKSGPTPLHFAAQRGHLAVVRILIENGAEISPQSGGPEPEALATGRGHKAIAKLLHKERKPWWQRIV